MDSSTSATQSQQSYPYSPTSPPPNRTPKDAATVSKTIPVASPGPSSTSDISPPPNGPTAAAPSPLAPSPVPPVDGTSETVTVPLQATSNAQLSQPIDFLPYSYWLPHQSNVYYAQLLHYNKLVSPSRGGGLQAAPLPPVVSASNAQAGPRSRSSSKVSLKDSSSKNQSTGGHGSRTGHPSDKNRSVIAPRDAPSHIMAPKTSQAQAPSAEPARSRQMATSTSSTQQQAQGTLQSSSVPTTPHQRAREFSLGSRDPSPGEAANNHSPRSAYSETNNSLPSLLPHRPGGCRYETAQINSRRRMPYSIGSDKLEKPPLGKIKGKLTEEEEKKLAADMREVYERLLPSDKVEEKRGKLVRKLEKILNDRWPGHDIKAHLFGSSGNLLCSDDSDVDICITTSWRDLADVCMIADLLARRGMEKVVCISAARVPIVKIWDPELDLACDINVNNTLALENTRMIRVYVEIDPRVRQLMMIIKHWTRRRVIKDAAFGGTLSSYTWICLIIAFLQLRTPSVLPALHQLPYRTQRSNGVHSDFADNIKKLRGYGSKNKSSEADLLFQFFRFYAHEFDYDKYVLSVRLGKMIPKTDKGWQAGNNWLCVEEPFTTKRNLGNTADEYSFRGLHMELRRAFDLISEAKFEEACEEYNFPKEEERVFTRPPNQPRPALLRSASQTNNGSGRGGRGGHRGGRHGNNRGGGSNRRTSSGVPTHDNVFQPAINMQQDLAWYPNTPYGLQYSQEFLAQLAYQQQESYRQMQMYGASPALGQQQGMEAHMAGSGSTPNQGQAQSSRRSRTNSINGQQPLTAPLRPDLFALYGMALNSPVFAQAPLGYGQYGAPAPTSGGMGQDLHHRPSQRSSTTSTDRGGAGPSSSLRSQSQPAARSPVSGQTVVPSQNLPTSQSFAGASSAGTRNANGVPIPSFMSDDADFDPTPKAESISPNSEERFAGFFPTDNADGARSHQLAQSSGAAGSIAFGDMAGPQPSSGPERRRLSTDQIPQTILDRRMRRTSRSPSPMGHARNFSTGNGSSLGPVSTAVNPQTRATNRPLVVNGSSLRASVSAAPRTVDAAEQPPGGAGSHAPRDVDVPETHALGPVQLGATAQQPIMANGSSTAAGPDEACFRDRIAMLTAQYMVPHYLAQVPPSAGGQTLSAMSGGEPLQQPQNAAIAPLDLAVSQDHAEAPAEPEASLLSPVYENIAPSPTTPRKPLPRDSQPGAWAGAVKQNLNVGGQGMGPQEASQKPKNTKPSGPAPAAPAAAASQAPKVSSSAWENGLARGAKSESEGGWQKAGKGKKKVAQGTLQGHAEAPPKHISERKGG